MTEQQYSAYPGYDSPYAYEYEPEILSKPSYDLPQYEQFPYFEFQQTHNEAHTLNSHQSNQGAENTDETSYNVDNEEELNNVYEEQYSSCPEERDDENIHYGENTSPDGGCLEDEIDNYIEHE